jgi:hypothetical protein
MLQTPFGARFDYESKEGRKREVEVGRKYVINRYLQKLLHLQKGTTERGRT